MEVGFIDFHQDLGVQCLSWSPDVPAIISKNACHLPRANPELVWPGVVSVASADLCQTTVIAKLEAACVGRGPWLILVLSLTYYGTLSAALLSPQPYLHVFRRQDLWIRIPLLFFYAEVSLRGYSHVPLK